MKSITILLIYLNLVILSSCNHNIEKPPLISDPAAYPILDSSIIEIPITISAYSAKRSILNSLENPIASGSTGEIDVNLLATEQISEEELIKELIKPATPGYWKDITVESFETVKESFKCALKPWKWGTCWQNVTKKVFKTSRVWVEPTEAIYRYTSKPVSKLIDKIYPVRAKINYRVDITDVDLNFSGNNINTTTYLKVKMTVDYEQATVPLGPKIKLKGGLTCELEAKLDLKASISIDENKVIKCSVDEGATNLIFTKVCLPGAVETFDIAKFLDPHLLVSHNLLGKIIDKTINDKISEAIERGKNKLTFEEQFNQLSIQLRNPLNIGQNLWLSPNITRVFLSPFISQGAGLQNQMKVTVGLVGYPNIKYTANTPPISGSDILPFSIKEINNPSVSLFVANRLDYSIASKIIDTLLNDAIISLSSKYNVVDKWLKKKKYYAGNVQIYPSGKKLVVGVDILKRKNSQKVITLYLWAVPSYNEPESYFFFENIEFTLETKNYLLKTLKNVISIDLVENAIKKEITKNAKFDVSKEYKMISDTLSNIRITENNIDLVGSFTPVKVSQIYPTRKDLVIYATLKGKLNLSVNPINQLADNDLKVLSPQVINSNQELILAAKSFSSPEYSELFNTSKAIHKGSIKNPKDGDLFRSNSNAAIASKLNNNKLSVEGKFIPAINIGDTIFFENGNSISFRIAELKDKTIPGDTILIRDGSGNLNMFIVK